MSPSSLPAPEPAGALKRGFIRYAIRLLLRTYLRVRIEGLEQLPAATPYMLNFSHPNWIDPFLVAAYWPRAHRIFIFGPKEEDMSSGWRNRVIIWSRLAVPFKPSRSDLIDTTRRATAVLNAGYALGIAGEGRLSDREGEIVPLEDGVAFLALRANVPIVPMAIIGTRWLRFRKQVTLRIGPMVESNDRQANRGAVAHLTKRLQLAMESLLVGVGEEGPPGPFGRWLTDVFNERPWLTQPDGDSAPQDLPPDASDSAHQDGHR